MDFTRMKQLVVPEGVVKKVEIGGKTVWQASPQIPSLGGSLTAAQSTAISAGDFIKTPVGEYWTFTDVPYTYKNENNATVSDTYSGTMIVADCDYYLNTGDTKLKKHHVVVVPNRSLYSAKMNDSNTTSGGYVGSKMRTVHLRRAEAIFKACFGAGHVLSHREYLFKGMNSNTYKETNGAWYDSTVELMDERMIFGITTYANTSSYVVSNRQLKLFKDNPSKITIGTWWWLRHLRQDMDFVLILNSGNSHYEHASTSHGVRPYALIY